MGFFKGYDMEPCYSCGSSQCNGNECHKYGGATRTVKRGNADARGHAGDCACFNRDYFRTLERNRRGG